jgi:hypothetical protein
MYNTLTVVDSDNGFRFGGYSSVKYGSSTSRVPDPNGVIFSLTKKSVHRQYQNQSVAFYPGSDYLGCFYDFWLADNCNTSNSSNCNFGHVYRTPNGIQAKSP